MNILAVSIPAYKRPDLLLRNLLAIAPQCHRRSVSLYVFDDSCCDINQAVYDEISVIWPCLRIIRNPTNLGIDRNIDQCISVPNADYVWMIGEDDLAADGSIDVILNRVEQHPDYLFVNYQYISNDYSKLLHVAIKDLGTEFFSAGEFFSRHGWATGFLGANVVNRRRWNAESTEYMGTYFNHVGKIFSQLEPSDTVEVIAQPLVYNRAESLDSFSWLNDSFEVYAGFGVMIERLVQRHPDWDPYARVCLASFMTIRDLKSVLVLRALGVYSLDKYRLYMSMLPLWPAYALVAVTPVALLKPLYQAYRALKSRLAAR